MKKIIAMLLLFLFLPVSALADLQVHFLNVGQGDCTIIICDGEAMVIDGGPAVASDYVYSYIRNTLELQHIDLLHGKRNFMIHMLIEMVLRKLILILLDQDTQNINLVIQLI